MLSRSLIFAAATLGFAAAANTASAGHLYDAFCKGPTPTPDYICNQIKAAEKPVLNPVQGSFKAQKAPANRAFKKAPRRKRAKRSAN